ncbi:MAG: hypothetical protein RSF70_08935 [Ruthenibacterium sp.]
MDTKELTDALRDAIHAEQAETNALAHKKLLWARLGALACVGIFVVIWVSAFVLIPKIDTALVEITAVTHEISGIDWTALAANIDKLATTGQESMTAATKALAELDIAALNSAIRDLQVAVAPLARLFGK